MSVTFLDLQTQSLLRVDVTMDDVEADTLSLIKNAVNSAYMILACKVDKRTTTITMALDDYNNKLPLPSDFLTLALVEHEVLGELGTTYYEKKEDILYFKNKDITSGDVTLTYSSCPARLVNDNDVIKLKDFYIGAVTAYAAYTYQLYKKKYGAAQLLLNEFNYYLPSNTQAQAQVEAQQTTQ